MNRRASPSTPEWLDRTLRQRCPSCGEGMLFERALTMYESCPNCGLDFVGEDGAQYGGAIVLAYGVGGTCALLVLILLLQFGALSRFAIWVTLGTAFAAIIGSFRYCKAFWTWLLYRSGELSSSDG